MKLIQVTSIVVIMLILALSHLGQSHARSEKGESNSGRGYGAAQGPKGRGFVPPITSSPPPLSPPSPPPPSPSTPTTTTSGLKVGFYEGLCPNKLDDIQAILTLKVQELFRKNSTILPALLRLQFHDCFVHGCDASILIDGPSSEKAAGPNLSVRGYDVIDALKDIAEAQCPGVVSCADIIAIATKEVIKMGGGPDYQVETGRRDGLVSKSEDVNLPSPSLTVSQSISEFSAKKFTPEEMVILLGCHSVGISHCQFFEARLYNDTTQFDPLMDPTLRNQLKQTCPKNANSNNVAFLDQNPQSSNILDNSFFDQIVKQRGILPIDQDLARDPQTSAFVLQFAGDRSLFNNKLASAMVKLQALDVLTGSKGQIRKTCSRIN
ncbi:peroxidase 57-like [Spinacia oleracea]|uniref:Peroxidase n=1 Tax=Spinacia oleracea TaxID=3562 RepID=A0A9R0K088_SPIOL|nr:peroxidase 57-like [Spinacia oleracea]